MTNSDKELQKVEISVTHSLEHYKNHCEFLGYSIVEENDYSITCNHLRKDSMRLILLNHGAGVMAQILYRIPEQFSADLSSLFLYVNDLNGIFIFIKACIRGVEDRRPFIALTSVLEGDYSRKNFAIFLDNLEQDIDQFHSYPKTRDMWRPQDD
jgi:hypothetical protein